jgi:hypothetical protein
VTPRVDRHQRAALRQLRATFGDVQVLAVERREVDEGAGTPLLSPASQQLALTIQTPPAPRCRRHDPDVGQEHLPDPSTHPLRLR